LKVLRQGEAGEGGTIEAMLSPDGRHFWWTGPAEPKNSHRVEVWESDSGRIRRFPGGSSDALVSDDGNSLWLNRGQQTLYFDLGAGGPAQRIHYRPTAASGDSRWLVCESTGEQYGRRIGVSLHRRGEGQPWLQFRNHLDHVTVVPVFSRDGRYLAWGVDRGTVKVADLLTLNERIGEFEKAILPE
jgi:hypothetical protein